VVERGPEKAGVGGSIPSLATILFNDLAKAARKRHPLSTRDWVSGGFDVRCEANETLAKTSEKHFVSALAGFGASESLPALCIGLRRRSIVKRRLWTFR
jgi:hypothetical protein